MANGGKPERVPSVRLAPDSETVLKQLGLLKDLAGTWEGHGFNLIARPDFEGDANLYLELNQTDETLKFDPIGSAIPNRGFGQDDIELFGLTYLQKIHEASTGGALHIEPGIWITQPPTEYPKEEPKDPNDQIVARMASIPHGNALLARGTAASLVKDAPTLPAGAAIYAGSIFPSFNSTPFGVGTPINAAGSSEKDTAPVPPGFPQYTFAEPATAANPRTPFPATKPPLPNAIDGVEMQEVINDPVTLLQAAIKKQQAEGYTFKEVVTLNIATQAEIPFLEKPNDKTAGPPVQVEFGSGGIENIPFLTGIEPPPPGKGPNARTAIVYATFWIEKVSHPDRPEDFMQLQYAQMTVLDFPILKPVPPAFVDLSWPHVSVATLRRSFL